jgi:hypothetical protein
MKFKIKKITKGSNVHYRIQKKILFWWTTITDSCVDIHGGYSEYPYRFDSRENAIEFINEHLINPKVEEEVINII